MKKIISILAVIILILIGAVFLFNREEEEALIDEKKVSVVNVQEIEFSDKKNFTAIVVGENQLNLGPKIAGRLEKIKKTTGESFKRGEVLAVIDGDELRVQAGTARESVESIEETLEEADDYYDEVEEDAEENYDIAKDEYERLKNSGSATQEEIKAAKVKKDLAKEALQSAEELSDFQEEQIESELTAARGQLKNAQTMAANTVIKAPYDGVILEKYMEEGSIVAAGTPIFNIAKTASKEVSFEVTEEVIKSINTGYNIEINGENGSCSAEIYEIKPLLNESSQKSLVKAKINENDNCGLIIGELVSVSLSYGKSYRSIAIPQESIVKFYYDSSVFVVKEEEGELKAERKLVQTGKINDNLIEISSGLEDEELIVVEGQHYLNNNDKVTIYEK